MGVLAVGDRLVVAGANFLTLVAVGRAAGVEALGVFALAWTVLLLVNAASEALVITPFTVLATRHRRALARARHAGAALVFQITLGLGAALLCLLVATALWAGGADPVVRGAAWCLALALPASAMREFARRFLFARLLARRALVLDATATTLQLLTVAALWVGGALSPATALLAIAFGQGLPALVWTLAAARAFRRPPRPFALAQMRAHGHFSRWLCAAQLSDLAVAHGVAWWVAALAGATATGLFSAANSIVLVTNPLMLGIGSILLPRAAMAHHRHGLGEVARIVWKVTGLLAVTVGLASLVVVAASGLVLALLYGLAPDRALLATVAFLALANVAGALGFAIDNGLMVMGRQDVNFGASLLGLVVTFAGAAALLPLYGIVGAAASVALGTAANTTWQVVMFARLAGRPGTVRGAA